MDDFSTMLPLFIVPLGDDPEEERKLRRFQGLLRKSGVSAYLQKRPIRDGFGGRPMEDPTAMLATVLFAFGEDGGFLRSIESDCRFDLRYIYLMSGARPSYVSFANFINGTVLPHRQEIFACVTKAMLSEMGISPSDEVFLDGSKFEANANKYKFVYRPTRRMEKLMEKAVCMFREHGIESTETAPSYSVRIARLVNLAADRILSTGKNPREITAGRGIRLTPDERLYVMGNRMLVKMAGYEESERICGSRNSYYKTDCDATAMCLKEDYYSGLGSNMHAAYNVQLAVSRGMIVAYYVSQDRTDQKTLTKTMDRFREIWGIYPSNLCADAGYGSMANYSYLSQRRIGNYVKFGSWEGEISGKRPARIGIGEDGKVRCLAGRDAAPIDSPGHHGHYSGSAVYEVKSCLRCPYRLYCRKNVGKERRKMKGRTFETSPEYLRFKKEAKDNLLSPKGIELRVNRSIQIEGTFGILKQDLRYDRFRRRGLDRADCEIALVCLGANLRKYFRFLASGKLPEYWQASADLKPEQPKPISRAVKKGGVRRQKGANEKTRRSYHRRKR